MSGGFELTPMRRLEVGPAVLTLSSGELSAGPHLVSSDLRVRLGVTVEPFDVQALKGMEVFRPISATVKLDSKDFSPALLALYFDGLVARGTGSLAADVRVGSDQFASGTDLAFAMERVHGKKAGVVYDGAPRISAFYDAARNAGLQAHAVVPNFALLPVAGSRTRVDLGGLVADVTRSGHDIVAGLGLQLLSVHIEEARVVDARGVRSAATGSLSFLVSPQLGDGPLTASGGVDVTKDVALARLRHLRLGEAELHGAARKGKAGWDGAAAGSLGALPFGIRMKQSKPELVLPASDEWLNGELAAAGIRFEASPTTQ